MIVDDVEILEQTFKVMQLDDYDTKAVERISRCIEQYGPLCPLNVHLQDEIVVAGLVGIDPVVEGDRRFVIDDPEKFFAEMHHIALDRRSVHRSVGQIARNSPLDETGLKSRTIIDAGRETCSNSLEVVRNQVATVAIGSQPDERMFSNQRMKLGNQGLNRALIGLLGYRYSHIQTRCHKGIFH